MSNGEEGERIICDLAGAEAKKREERRKEGMEVEREKWRGRLEEGGRDRLCELCQRPYAG